MHASLRALAAGLALSLTLTACSGGDDPAPAPSPSPTATAAPPSPSPEPSPSPTEEPGTPRPLNGVPTTDEEALQRRVIAVKIDDHELARPQTGLDQADAIIELIVEAGLTRFIALYHSQDADVVGPMRSGRPTDPTLLLPLGAVFTISGAQPWVIDRIVASGVPLIGEIGRPATFRSSQRRAPHNLYVDTAALRDVADERGYDDDPPPSWFTFADWGEGQGGVAGDVLLRWSDTTTVTWRFRDGVYARLQDDEPHLNVTADGDTEQLAADTLVVLEADRYTARPPGRGTAVPALDTVGAGSAYVFHDGRVVEGSWSRDDSDELFQLVGFDGRTLTVPPGRLWVSVFPAGRTVSW